MKKRSVFLFGAGATTAWGMPTTSKLTDIILESGYRTKNDSMTVTKFIYETLLSKGFTATEVNFETVLNVIEELVIYYGNFNYSNYGKKKLPSLANCFFDPVYENELLNFSIKGGVKKHGYQLQVPGFHDSNYSYHDESPEQFYFQHLINEILAEISSEISHYAYHTNSHSVIQFESEVSKLFTVWMVKLSKINSLRMYTLNYERIFKILLERAGISIFEGFDCGECVDDDVTLRANIPRILTDAESNIYYNLHGSSFWEVLDLDKEQLPNAELGLIAIPHLQSNNSPASFQVEKGKTLLITNIITGYQKAQKSMITPFKQMNAAFDKDCCFADIIYVVGYSFGDEHINESIKTAIRHNPYVKVIIVDPSFIKNDMDFEFFIRFFPYRQSNPKSRKKVADNLYSFLDGQFIVHTLSFEDYLKIEAASIL